MSDRERQAMLDTLRDVDDYSTAFGPYTRRIPY